MRILCAALLAASLSFVPTVATADEAPKAADAQAETCQHGVKAAICTRCNPKLEPVFKAKGDWCPEHARPETQCVICHPELAAKGIK